MKVYLVCPFSKPEFKQLTLLNFQQQEYKDKHLIVVENGMGVGSFQQTDQITVLQSEKHQSIAKNVGLAHLRSIGAEYWATLDCDDYYGPQYLTEMISNADKAPVVGKRCYFVRLNNEKLILYNTKELQPDYHPAIWGATIGAWVEKSPDFDIVHMSEESLWVKKFRPLKGVYNTGPENFIHLRWGHGHVTNGMDTNYWNRIKGTQISKKVYPDFAQSYVDNDVYHTMSPWYDERRKTL